MRSVGGAGQKRKGGLAPFFASDLSSYHQGQPSQLVLFLPSPDIGSPG